MRIGRLRPHAFVLLELLIVLAVVAILAGSYFSKSNNPNKHDESTYEMSIGRSESSACKANRAALLTSIQMFKMNNPTLPANSENLQKAGVQVPKCPDGGAYGFTKENTIVCSKHPD